MSGISHWSTKARIACASTGVLVIVAGIAWTVATLTSDAESPAQSATRTITGGIDQAGVEAEIVSGGDINVDGDINIAPANPTTSTTLDPLAAPPGMSVVGLQLVESDDDAVFVATVLNNSSSPDALERIVIGEHINFSAGGSLEGCGGAGEYIWFESNQGALISEADNETTMRIANLSESIPGISFPALGFQTNGTCSSDDLIEISSPVVFDGMEARTITIALPQVMTIDRAQDDDRYDPLEIPELIGKETLLATGWTAISGQETLESVESWLVTLTIQTGSSCQSVALDATDPSFPEADPMDHALTGLTFDRETPLDQAICEFVIPT